MDNAIISDCGKYRYSLTRDIPQAVRWVRPVTFIMLNPSTADAIQDDPTIRRCIGFANSWLCTSLTVLNLFALRSTDPKQLYKAEDPVGPRNNQAIIYLSGGSSGTVICAWGKHGNLNGRGEEVLKLLKSMGITPMALKLNKDGTPAHPLYLAKDLKPFNMEA